MNCDYPDEKACLNVFDSEPKNLPKCYCTLICPEKLEDVKKNCTSGNDTLITISWPLSYNYLYYRTTPA